MTFLFYLTMILFIIVCLFLVLLILIQKGRGGGLAGAFGGAGGNTAFGAKTGDVLTWATSVVFGIFLVLAIALNIFANQVHEQRMTPTAPPPPQQSAAGSGLAEVEQPRPAPQADPNRPLTPIEIETTVPPRGDATPQPQQPQQP